MTERILNHPGVYSNPIGVENSGQNRYAESSVKNNMSNQPSNPELKIQEQVANKKLEVPKEEPKISEDTKKNDEAKKAAEEFAKQKVAVEQCRAPQEAVFTEVVQNIKQDAKKYIPQLPSNPGTASAVKQFYREYQSLSGPPSVEFLTRHYLKLRDSALKEGLGLDFLSQFKNELTQRGINADALDVYASKSVDLERAWGRLVEEKRVNKETARKMIENRILPMPGGEETRPPLQIRVPPAVPPDVKKELSALNAVLQAYGEPDGNEEALQKALENIAKLEPALAGPAKDATDGVIAEISRRLGALYRGRKEAEQERVKKIEKREKKGFYQERILTDEEIDEVRQVMENVISNPRNTETTPMEQLLKDLEPADKLFNRMFDRAEANPHTDFEHAAGGAGQQEFMLWLAMLNDLREEYTNDPKKEGLVKKLIQKYSSEHKLRELLHNVFYIAETGGEAKEFAGYTKQFQSEFADLAFLGAPEVEVAFRIREQVLYQIKRENNGTIPYEKIAFIAEKGWSEWELRADKLMHEANRAGIFGEELKGWKLERALSISRGMGMVLLRFPEIVAECRLSSAPSQYEGQKSIPWETISWELNPLDHKIKRYDIGREMQAILAATLKRKKKGMWNQDELMEAYNLKAVEAMSLFDEDGEERMLDMRNMTKIGGWQTHSGWRAYDSALLEDQSKLRPQLYRNPGIGTKLLFNRYLIGDVSEARNAFIRSYKTVHPEATDQQMLKDWEKREAELKAGDVHKQRWSEADIQTWKGAARRIPHVILRVITDLDNRLMSESKRKELLREIFKDASGRPLTGDALEKAYSELETWMTIAKENLMKRRREAIEKAKREPDKYDMEKVFTDNEDQLLDVDFAKISDSTVRNRALKLKEVVTREVDTNKDLQEKIVGKVQSRAFPFVITNEDVPFGEYRFAQTGGRGLITRRNNDWYQEVEANNAIVELIKHLNVYQSPDQILEQLHKIYDLAEVHDRDRANDLIEYLAIGLIRFYQKDGALKIPLYGEIMGPINAARHRGNSFAQTIYGGKAMDLEADDIWYFTEQLRSILIGKDGLERIDRIRKETGGTLFRSIVKKTKVALYLLALFGTYEWAQSLIKEK